MMKSRRRQVTDPQKLKKIIKGRFLLVEAEAVEAKAVEAKAVEK